MSADTKRRIIGWLIFTVYIGILLKITVFRNDFLQHPFFSDGAIHPPFTSIRDIFATGRLVYVVYLVGGNIAWFVPFGFLLPYLTDRPKRLVKILLFGLLLSLFIETLQFVFGTGESEPDDLILNTLGAGLGFLLYRLYIMIKDRKYDRKDH